MPNSIEIKNPILTPHQMAKTIANHWTTWNDARNSWLEEKKELRQYLFATDTRKTTNKQLPWKNSTVTPKLTQLRDNLHANYIAALFPNDDWFVWEAADRESTSLEKKRAILNYMKGKLRGSGFEVVVSQLIYDYIDYGNCFVGHTFVNEEKVDPQTGEAIALYRGPKAFRVSPLDVVMDPTAESFHKSPFIRRVLKSIGDLEMDLDNPYLGYDRGAYNSCRELRQNLTENNDWIKSDGLVIDGFGSIEQYFQSGMVELLEFWGDIYNPETKEYKRDQVITVVDRMYILRQQDNQSWLGQRPFHHVGWRLRPDNLWAQGPLDQLIGMQYRIDHLENLKADVFDQIAHPFVIIKGDTVEDFTFGPNQQVHVGLEGDIQLLRPDAGALSADMEIATLMERMEELAGAPRQAMGIRTPGEKTKYEVQVLENGAGRIFQNKVNWFERNILEPLLNSMLEECRRSIAGAEKIRVVNPELGAEEFIEVTQSDITARGKLFPIGARHYAEQAKFIQELTQTMQMVEAMPAVAAHVSGFAIAKALEENLGWSAYKLVRKNVRIIEQSETQKMVNTTQEQVAAHGAAPSELQPSDMIAPEGMDESNPDEAQAEGVDEGGLY